MERGNQVFLYDDEGAMNFGAMIANTNLSSLCRTASAKMLQQMLGIHCESVTNLR